MRTEQEIEELVNEMWNELFKSIETYNDLAYGTKHQNENVLSLFGFTKTDEEIEVELKELKDNHSEYVEKFIAKMNGLRFALGVRELTMADVIEYAGSNGYWAKY